MNGARRLLPVAMILAPAVAHAQRCDERPGALVADLGLHVVNVGYQRGLGCYAVAQLSGGLYVPWMVNNNALGLAGADHDPAGDTAGFVLRVRAFVFPLGTAPGGFWLSPFAQTGFVRGTRAGFERVGPALAVGLSAGWTFTFGPRVLLALGLGAQYHVVAFDGSSAFPGFSGFAPTVDLNLGYRL